MKTKQVKVTDHAVLRYMQRILGVDVPAIRKGILTKRMREQIELANGKCKIETLTHSITVVNYTVVTVTPTNK